MPPRRGRLRALIEKLFDRLHALAEAGWATSAVAAWNLLQGSVVPGPVDALFLPLGLADPPRVWRFAVGALLGSVAGAAVAWSIGAFAYESIGLPVLGLIGLDAGDMQRVRGLFERHGPVLVLMSTVTPLSTKLVSIGAGAFGVALLPVLAMVALGRGVRFAVFAVLVRYAGHRVEHWVHARRPAEEGER